MNHSRCKIVMCVVVTLRGRLGNNLFQYALGRIIAEEKGLQLECRRVQQPTPLHIGLGLDVGPITILEGVAQYFPNAPLRIDGRRIESPVEQYEMEAGGLWRGHVLDLGEVLSNSLPRQIRLCGYFQRFSYLAPYKHSIRRWFEMKHIATPYDLSARDVVVNIRRGSDYDVAGWTLPMSYYERVLSNLSDRGLVYVCGVCIDEQVRQSLAKFAPVYYDASPIEHFAFIMRFSRIVLSNSTFAWWAAFLSDAAELYAPRARHARAYGFTGYSDVDLHMREDRYHEIGVDAVAE